MTSTALVLGGGGVTGIAWELGLLKGLRDAGVDLTSADTVIGTSAGSVVGAQVTGTVDLDELYAAQTRPANAEIAASLGLGVLLRLGSLMLRPGSRETKRGRVGRAALEAHPGPATERLRVIGQRLRTASGEEMEWPADRDLRITAVEAETGRFRVFDKDGGVDLLHAVTASCAVPLVWPPVDIDGTAYVDGGVRSAANADVVRDREVVLVIAPLARSFSRHHSLPRQLARTGARRTAVISPDPESVAAIGKNVLDPARRADAARAGLAQAAKLAGEVARGWP